MTHEQANQSPAEGDELPPLPDGVKVMGAQSCYFTARHMREYARAALANVQPKGTATPLTDAELERQTGEPHIDGWPLYSGLPSPAPGAVADKMAQALADFINAWGANGDKWSFGAGFAIAERASAALAAYKASTPDGAIAGYRINIREIAEQAGISMDCWDMGAASLAHSDGVHGVTREHLEKFASLYGFACWNAALEANQPNMQGFVSRAIGSLFQAPAVGAEHTAILQHAYAALLKSANACGRPECATDPNCCRRDQWDAIIAIRAELGESDVPVQGSQA